MENTRNKRSNKSRPTVQSLDRGLLLLDCVISAEGSVALGELANLVGVEKSSAHRLMATLMCHGYAMQDAQKGYIPGPAIMEQASKLGNRGGVHELAGPFLSELAKMTGETAHLGILGRDQVVLTNCVASNHALAVTSRVGEAEPLYCTALGKALICDYDEQKLKALLGKGRLKKYTKKSTGSISSFINELVQIRTELLAKDDEEFREGVRCLAAPVKNFYGAIVAAIGISGPSERLTKARFAQMGEHVKRIGINLSQKLGFVQKD